MNQSVTYTHKAISHSTDEAIDMCKEGITRQIEDFERGVSKNIKAIVVNVPLLKDEPIEALLLDI